MCPFKKKKKKKETMDDMQYGFLRASEQFTKPCRVRQESPTVTALVMVVVTFSDLVLLLGNFYCFGQL